MSEAVLRTRNQFITAVTGYTGYRVILMPRHPSEVQLPSEYVDLVLDTKLRRKIPPAGQEQEAGLVEESIMHNHGLHEWLWMAAVFVTVMIILVGLVIGYLRPGPITGIILPVGLAMWWLLYKLADRHDQLA